VPHNVLLVKPPFLTVLSVLESESIPQFVTVQTITMMMETVNNVITGVETVLNTPVTVPLVQKTLTDLNLHVNVTTVSSMPVLLNVKFVDHNVMVVNIMKTTVLNVSGQETVLQFVTVQKEPSMKDLVNVNHVHTNVKNVTTKLNNVTFVPLTESMLQTVTVKPDSMMNKVLKNVKDVLIDVTLVTTVLLV
jgi:hypothetical protein